MARPMSARKENHVEAQIGCRASWVAGEPVLRGADDARAIDALQRLQLAGRAAACLDLDKDHSAEALGDEVDLAKRGFVAPRQDAVELEPQQPGRQRLAAMATAIGGNVGATLGL